jgi:hypothetical protein
LKILFFIREEQPTNPSSFINSPHPRTLSRGEGSSSIVAH